MPGARESAAITEVLAYLGHMRKVAADEVRRRGVSLLGEELRYATIPLLHLWLRLSRHEILFFDYRSGPPASIAYTWRPAPGFSWSYRKTAGPRILSRYAAWGGVPAPVFRFECGRAAYLDHDESRFRASWITNMVMAERGFIKNLRRINDLTHARALARQQRYRLGNYTISPGSFHEMSTILLVSAIENLLKDAFFAYRDFWFAHIPGQRRRETIAAVMRKAGMAEEFLLAIFSADSDGDPIATALARTLSSSEPRLRSRLNFQRLSGDLSAGWFYKEFFGIDLSKQGPPGGWANLKALFERRHSLVHGLGTGRLSKRKVRQDILMVDAFEKSLMAGLFSKRGSRNVWL